MNAPIPQLQVGQEIIFTCGCKFPVQRHPDGTAGWYSTIAHSADKIRSITRRVVKDGKEQEVTVWER